MRTTATDGEKFAAFNALTTLDPGLFLNNATYFSCTEADTIVLFVHVAYGNDMAANFLKLHAEGDGVLDEHNPDGTSRLSVIDKEIK